MAQSVSLSFRVSSEKAAELDKLAEATERPKSWLLEKALDSYLEEQAWQIEHIKAGIKAADEGRLISHEKVSEWLRSWGTDHELDPPEIDRKK